METRKIRFKVLDILYFGIYSLIFKKEGYKIGQDNDRIVGIASLYISVPIVLISVIICSLVWSLNSVIDFIKLAYFFFIILLYFVVSSYFDDGYSKLIVEKYEVVLGKKKGKMIGFIFLFISLFMAFGVPFILSKFK
jgi:hypothetical protein